MKYLHWAILGLECLSPTLYAVTINTTSVPDYPQPPVPPLIEKSTPDTLEVDITPAPEPQPAVHTVYPIFVDNPPEYEDSETVAFPPDSSNQAMAESTAVAASITLRCNPVEYGTPVTTTEMVPVVAIIAVFDPPFPVNTGKTRESIKTTYGLGWLAPDPDKDENDQTIEGIDVDNDCVRDDIENYIYRKVSGPGNIAKRKYLFEYAKWLGAVLSSSVTIAQAKDISNNLDKASYCTRLRNGDTAATNQLIDDVFAEYLDTFPRSRRYIQNRSKLFGWSTREDLLQSCT